MTKAHSGWLAGCFCLGMVSLASAAESSSWQVQQDKSSIEWTAMYGGKPITGAFRAFTSEIVFDPEHLDAASVLVKVETAKVTSDDKDAEQSLPSADWFDAAAFPVAVFEAHVFRHVADERYEAEGTLTIGEKKNPLTLPFTAHFYEDKETATPTRYAQVTAETSLKRLDYGVGKGEWSKTEQVGDDVKLVINLKAIQPEAVSAVTK